MCNLICDVILYMSIAASRDEAGGRVFHALFDRMMDK